MLTAQVSSKGLNPPKDTLTSDKQQPSIQI